MDVVDDAQERLALPLGVGVGVAVGIAVGGVAPRRTGDRSLRVRWASR